MTPYVTMIDNEYIRTGGNEFKWDYLTVRDSTFVVLFPHALVGGIFENAWFSIKPTFDTAGNETVTMVVKKDYTWDGATVVPDINDGVLSATQIHDPIYQFAEFIAVAWQWTVKKVLELADTFFKLIMEYKKVSPAIVTAYYKGVSWFGFNFHRLNVWRKSLFDKYNNWRKKKS